MAKLSSKVQSSLDEGRILVLGVQILIGFGFRAFFEPAFEDLPAGARASAFASLTLLVLAFVLLVTPSAHHRLVERGEDTLRIQRFASRVATAALLPFAAGIALALGVAMWRVAERSALPVGAAAGAVALAAWYAWPLARRRRARPAEDAGEEEEAMAGTPVDKKIRHVLTEARTVLPGAQALLGFQLAVTLTERFGKLEPGAKALHAASALLIALAVVLLVAPAAYHRIAEDGEETERFHRVASALVLLAMPPLALALAGELALVTWLLVESAPAAALAGALTATIALAAWFGFALRGRAARRRERRTAAAA